jgi:tRNA threonylcarbamoyladenosine biosynthesis protein TsaB
MLKQNSFTVVAIETSSELASVALLRGEILTVRQSAGALTHSMTVLAMLQELLADAGITLAQCDALGFGVGPGSFTGIRTACGLAQGLAFGANVPVVPVVSLLAMAEAARSAGFGNDIVAVLDARMGEVYWAQYHYDGEWQVVVAPGLSKAADVKPEGPVQACGNGLAAYPQDFVQLGDAPRHPALMPHAAQVVRLAAIAVSTGQTLHARDAQPLYLRNKVALTTRERLAGAPA